MDFHDAKLGKGNRERQDGPRELELDMWAGLTAQRH